MKYKEAWCAKKYTKAFNKGLLFYNRPSYYNHRPIETDFFL